jgi:hypothetical protein
VRKLTDNSEYCFRGNSLPILIKFSSQVDGLVFRESDTIRIGGGDFSLRYQIHTGSVTHAVLFPPGNISQATMRVLGGPKRSFSLVKWSSTTSRRPRCVEPFLFQLYRRLYSTHLFIHMRSGCNWSWRLAVDGSRPQSDTFRHLMNVRLTTSVFFFHLK